MTHMRRENEMRDSRFRDPFHPCRFLDAKRSLLPIDRRPLHRHVWIPGSVERNGVRAVGGILGALQPVTKLFAAPDHATSVTSNQQVVTGKQRRRFRTDVREHKASRFPGMIGWVLDTVLEGAVFRFGRLLQTFATSVIKPAVVTAANTVIFDPPKLKRCAAMGAVKIEQPQLVTTIAEENKVFAEKPYFDRSALRLHFFAESHRPPVTPEHITGGSAGTDSGQQFIFFV